jgi:hypothetical protein
VDLGFDETKVLSREQIAELKRRRPELGADVDFTGTANAGAVPGDTRAARAATRAARAAARVNAAAGAATMSACGAPRGIEYEPDEVVVAAPTSTKGGADGPPARAVAAPNAS